MQDRFKFRVWDVHFQQYRHYNLLDMDSLNDFAYFASDEAPDYDEQIKFPDNNCYALIIEQSTGLKDKKGELIFEGDIVKDDSLYVVKYTDEDVGSCGCCVPEFIGVGFVCEDIKKNSRGNLDDRIEVVGNIHENPELLRNQDD